MPTEGLGKARGWGCYRNPLPTRHGRPPVGYLLAVSITESQAEVVLLQEVEVLTDQVKQHLAPAVLLREREEVP